MLVLLVMVAGLGRLVPAPAWAAELEPAPLTVERAFLREDFQAVVQLAQQFLRARQEAPERPQVWLWLIFSLDRLGQPHEALRELDALKAQLMPEDPLWPEVWFWEGDISRRAFQSSRAVVAYTRLLERAPDSGWVAQSRIGLGLIALNQQRFEEAVAQFHEVVRRHPGEPSAMDAQLFEGLANLRLTRDDEAVAILTPLLDRLKDPR